MNFDTTIPSDPTAAHKLLLDLGETLLTHICGIVFGEYRRYWQVDEALEAEYYRNAKKKPSFGVYLSLLRKLQKADGPSVSDQYFAKSRKYPAASDFVFNFELLKNQIVNQGHDSGFAIALEPLLKGRTVGSKTILQFFETFVTVRNTFAHPEEKAKNPVRSWPLGDEYYALINPLMKSALDELITELEFLGSYPIALLLEINEEQNKAVFLEESGSKGRKVDLELSKEELDLVKVGNRYVFEPGGRIYSKFYQPEIPRVKKSIAPRIIEQEKAKMMEPVLRQMIGQKLDDGVIDDLEYLVLKDTAFSSFISEERLRALVEAVKSQLGIEGEVYVESKESTFRPMLNPHWLLHFSRLEGATYKQSSDCLDQSSLQKNLWDQINDYLQFLVESHLDNEEATWKIQPNAFQQGRMSFKYWGQIYPDHAPLKHGFNIGFIVCKKFDWIQVKKNNPLRDQLYQPCMLLYTTEHSKYLEKLDPEGGLAREYGRINYELLLRERKALEKMGGFTNALSYRTKDIHSFEDYFRDKSDCPEDESLWIYSKVWNCGDFTKDGAFHHELIYQIEKEVIAYLTLFSHSVLKINDYFMEHGSGDE